MDIVHDVNAVKEAIKLGVPIVGIVDTNADPTGITYPIPSNDDALKAISLVADYVKQAILSGQAAQKKTDDKEEK
jgi:small subunit ribosomal protein S2